MITSKQKKILDSVYYKLDYTLQGIHWGNYGKQLFNLIKKEEKEHRRYCPDSVKCGLSISDAVKLFFVHGIIDGLQQKTQYTIKDVLNIRPSVILAYSIALNYMDELNKSLEGINLEDVLSLDYAELMK